MKSINKQVLALFLFMVFSLTFFCPFSLVTSLAKSKPARNTTVYVVVNSTIKTFEVSRNDLKNIFLGRKKFLHGLKIKVFFLPLKSFTTKKFCDDVLGVPHRLFRQQMKEFVHSGKRNLPRLAETNMQMLKKVANTPGGMGYISKGWVFIPKGKLVHILKIK